MNQNRAKLMQKNNHFSGVNLSSLKNSPELFKVESANVYCHANPNISHIAQRKHICILTDAHCVSLGFLWLNVKGMIYFSSSVSFFMPENEISNSFKVIMAFILFHYYFLLQKN